MDQVTDTATIAADLETIQPQTRSTRPRATGHAHVFGGDLLDGVKAWRLWSALGWNDIRQRYRRSVLGPFWITLSMSVLVAVLGYIYSRIFKTDIRSYLPYLALGFIFWAFIQTTISESCGAFRESIQLIKQIKVPFSIHILRVVWRNFMVLLHMLVIFVPISIFLNLTPKFTAFLALPGLALICLNLIFLGLLLAILSTRFRDVAQIVATILQITIFATPIMWPISTIGENTFIANVNPIYHFIELVRAPLLGEIPDSLSWYVGIGMAVAISLIALMAFQSCRRQIVYWL